MDEVCRASANGDEHVYGNPVAVDDNGIGAELRYCQMCGNVQVRVRYVLDMDLGKPDTGWGAWREPT